MKQILIIILCCSFYFIQCSLLMDDDDYFGPIEYESFLASISIDGKNDQKIMSYAISGYATGADMYWLIDKESFLLRRDDLYIYNLNGEVIKIIQKPANIIDMDVSPDGSYAVMACTGDIAELYLLDIVSLDIRKITDSPEMVERYPRFSQNGQKIVYATAPGKSGKDPLALKLYDMVTDSSCTLKLRDDKNKHFIPFAMPCFGKHDEIVYFINNFDSVLTYAGTSKLYSLNLKSGHVTLIDENAAWAADMKYAPIGNRLVYLTSEPFWGIRVYDAAANRFYELGDKIQTECRAIGPNPILNINREGSIVVAGTDYCSDTNIYSINIENAEYFKIVLGTSPELSRDGKTILYVKTQPQEY